MSNDTRLKTANQIVAWLSDYAIESIPQDIFFENIEILRVEDIAFNYLEELGAKFRNVHLMTIDQLLSLIEDYNTYEKYLESL